jgi:hypothetical protein
MFAGRYENASDNRVNSSPPERTPGKEICVFPAGSERYPKNDPQIIAVCKKVCDIHQDFHQQDPFSKKKCWLLPEEDKNRSP